MKKSTKYLIEYNVLLFVWNNLQFEWNLIIINKKE